MPIIPDGNFYPIYTRTPGVFSLPSVANASLPGGQPRGHRQICRLKTPRRLVLGVVLGAVLGGSGSDAFSLMTGSRWTVAAAAAAVVAAAAAAAAAAVVLPASVLR